MHWPSRYWERGDLLPNGKWSWYSREVLPADKRMREDYEQAYRARQNPQEAR